MRKLALLKDIDVRPGTLPKWTPPSVKHIQRWVDALPEGGDTFLSLSGPDPLLRSELFRICYEMPGLQVVGNSRNTQDWFQKGILDDIAQRVRAITGRPWGLVWDLLDTPDFIVEEPLRGLIDQGFTFTGLFKALWEARFLLQEGKKPEGMALMGAVFRWLCGQELTVEQQIQLEAVHIDRELVTMPERLDMLLFLLALAYQNGLVDRTVFVLDGLERVVRTGPDKRKDLLRQLNEATTVFSRWAKLGSATGLVFGFDATGNTLESLTQYNERLGGIITSSYLL